MVARADDVVAVDRDLERRQLRVAADQLRDHLVDGRPRLDVRALGLLRVHRAHERGGGPRMLAAGVALVGRRVVVEPAQHQRVPAEALERLQDGGEFEPLALGGRGPVPHVHAVADVDRREPRRARRPRRQGRHHRVEERQRQGGPHAAQERPSRQRQLRDHHRAAPSRAKLDPSRPFRSRRRPAPASAQTDSQPAGGPPQGRIIEENGAPVVPVGAGRGGGRASGRRGIRSRTTGVSRPPASRRGVG